MLWLLTNDLPITMLECISNLDLIQESEMLGSFVSFSLRVWISLLLSPWSSIRGTCTVYVGCFACVNINICVCIKSNVKILQLKAVKWRCQVKV